MKGESALSSRLKLYTTENCLEKLNEAVLARFFDISSDIKSSEADVIILYGDDSFDRAVQLAGECSAAVLIVSDSADPRVLNRCTMNGILYCAVSEVSRCISPLYAMSVRLKAAESRADGLKRRLDDSKLVNRAKMLLISRLGMSENQAHRYIEKTAMDGCISKKEVAVRIIKTYED